MTGCSVIVFELFVVPQVSAKLELETFRNDVIWGGRGGGEARIVTQDTIRGSILKRVGYNFLIFRRE